MNYLFRQVAFFVLFLISFQLKAQQPNLQWGMGISGNLYENGHNVVVDKLGNSYISGTFNDVVSFGTSPSITSITAKGDKDIFVAKYDPNGNFIWVKSFGSVNADEPRSMAIDSNDNIFIAGKIGGDVNFDPSGNAVFTSKGSTDLFLASYDSDGNYRWAYATGNGSEDAANSIAIDKNNDVYLTGTFFYQVAFDPHDPTALTGIPSSLDFFIGKYTNDGNLYWVKNIGENNISHESYWIAVDDQSNVYVTGLFHLTVDFDPSASNAAFLTSKGNDAFVAKYDKDGNYQWAFNLNNSNIDDIVRPFCVLANTDGTIYLTGYYSGAADFDPSAVATNEMTAIGKYDGFFAKYSKDGAFIWSKSIGGLDGTAYLAASATDKDNNLYISGGFTRTVDFDPNSGVQNRVCTSLGHDAFIAKYDTEGNYSWVIDMDGTWGFGQGKNLYVDEKGNSFLIGSFMDKLDIDPGSCEVLLTAKVWDAFFAKYGPDQANLTDILAYSLPQQISPAVINKVNHTISIELQPGTDVSKLSPTIEVSPCSVITPASGVVKNFATPVVYTVTDKYNHTQQWTVNVTVSGRVTCSGRVTPIQVITLGTTANPVDLPGSTTYSRNESNPSDGSYGYFSTVPNVFGNAWQSGELDHTTGDANGRMLIFNASNEPGEFYRAPISGLCTNAIYRFSAFIANVLHKTRGCSPDNPVNVTFEIRDKNNNIIDQVSTGNIYAENQMKWMEFGIDFTGQTEVFLVMRNNGPGGCGNDLAIDDISFSICGSIDISSDVSGATSTETFVCNGANVNLKSTLISGFVNPDYQWQSSADNKIWNNIPGATTGSLALTNVQTTDPQYYRLIVAATGTINDPSSNCKVIASPFTVNVIGDPVLVSDNNKTNLCLGEKTVLRNTTGKARSYQWLLNGNKLTNSVADTLLVTDRGSYSLKITNDGGCERLSNAIQIETRPIPDAKFSFISDCSAPFRFFDDSKISDNSTLTYLWNFDDAASGANNTSTVKDPVHSFKSTGIKKVSLTVTSPYSCSKTFVYDVSVIGSNLKAAIQNLSVAPYCTNGEMVFKDASTIGLGVITYRKWEIVDAANQVVKTVLDDAQINFSVPGSTVSQSFKVRLTVGFSSVCTDIKELSFTIDPSPLVSLNLPVTTICANEPSFVLTGGMPLNGIGGKGTYTVDGVKQTSFSPQNAGPGEHIIRYTFKNSPTGCESYSEQKITVSPIPIIDCKDYTVVEGINEELKIIADQPGSAYSYQWAPADGLSDPTISNPVLSPTIDKTYRVTITNIENCSVQCVVNVTVLPKIEFTNVFTPNGDGKNDTWSLTGAERYPNMELIVFDRFGSQVFYSKGYASPWDGKYKNKSLSQGTYYYIIKPNVHQLKPRTGSITIIY
ncbi:hypothetical protein C3K47_18795 [Solitalea longa]|uniref:PKD domain-containing protein n=1 Tax=Solitalea longa TaxID=2079460 RepID=A0A2S4ZXH0_9SPHI|nr:gliding motility-associated C-terminal domain-containing protein [Solitalea longa]POY34687.1 hypothetical protein C3K47_18795 [Solitalea longa]